jgi:hypothetical protein
LNIAGNKKESVDGDGHSQESGLWDIFIRLIPNGGMVLDTKIYVE